MVAGAVMAGAGVTGGAPAIAATTATAATTPTAATETRQFKGEGSSSFGPLFAYHYAYADALRQAENAGFDSSNCTEVSSVSWPYQAWVTVECTR